MSLLSLNPHNLVEVTLRSRMLWPYKDIFTIYGKWMKNFHVLISFGHLQCIVAHLRSTFINIWYILHDMTMFAMRAWCGKSEASKAVLTTFYPNAFLSESWSRRDWCIASKANKTLYKIIIAFECSISRGLYENICYLHFFIRKITYFAEIMVENWHLLWLKCCQNHYALSLVGAFALATCTLVF
jgi:hypothetical protein